MEHFGASHQLIPISVYEESPEKYKKVLCEHHNKELAEGCRKCNKLVCSECAIEDVCAGNTIIY